MTLTHRLTLFSLAGLAAVLATYSTLLYTLARNLGYREVEARLASVLSVLTASAESKPSGFEWEPQEHGSYRTPDNSLVWSITDDDGRPVDQTVPAEFATLLAEAARQYRTTGDVISFMEERHAGPGGPWMFRQVRLRARDGTPAVGKEGDGDQAGEKLHPTLVFTVGASVRTLQRGLWELAAELMAVSLAVWTTALFLGRAVCRRALRPVTRMAAAATQMDAADLGHRLPTPETGDELENLGRAFNGMLGRVEESYERQQRFTAEASHQLRTPLAAVLGQVEVALRRDREPEEYRRVLESVHAQADRLRRIVEALLFLARADAEARLPGRERIDLGAWLPEYLRAWAGHPRRGDVAASTEPAFADVQPVLLGELLNVLLDNACKYSPAGSPIAVRVGRSGDHVELSVSDFGGGIAAEDAGRLFEPFFRSPDARRQGIEGLGLGLAVARRIAEAHGGTLAAESLPGRGSLFVVRVPLTRQE